MWSIFACPLILLGTAVYDWVNNHSECCLYLPDIANSNKGCLLLSTASSAIMSSIKNRVYPQRAAY